MSNFSDLSSGSGPGTWGPQGGHPSQHLNDNAGPRPKLTYAYVVKLTIVHAMWVLAGCSWLCLGLWLLRIL